MKHLPSLQILSRSFIFSSLAAAALFISSCSKSSDPGKTDDNGGSGTGKIYLPTRFHTDGEPATDDQVLQYNDQNLLSRFSTNGINYVITYNSNKQPVKIAIDQSGTPVQEKTITLNSAGKITRIDDKDIEDPTSVADNGYELFSYNAANQISTIGYYDKTAKKTYEVNFTYNAAGNIASTTATDDIFGYQNSTFEYDTSNGFFKNVPYIEMILPGLSSLLFYRVNNGIKHTDLTDAASSEVLTFEYNADKYPTKFTDKYGDGTTDVINITYVVK